MATDFWVTQKKKNIQFGKDKTVWEKNNPDKDFVDEICKLKGVGYTTDLGPGSNPPYPPPPNPPGDQP